MCFMLELNKQIVGEEAGLANRTQFMKYLPGRNRELTLYP